MQAGLKGDSQLPWLAWWVGMQRGEGTTGSSEASAEEVQRDKLWEILRLLPDARQPVE